MFLKAATGLVAALLAVFVYRSGHVVRYHFLTAPDLPAAYYAGGNVSSHCTLIQDPSDDLRFCEDIVFWDHRDAEGALTDRFVLIGCDPNRKAWNTVMGPLRDPSPRGHLFLYDTRTRVLERLALADYPPDHDFHPLGMDVYPSSSPDPSNLFVVNHARAQTTIEQLVLDPATKEARYVRTLRSPHFVSPNALAMTGPTRFLVSNDHRMTRRLPQPAGSVLPVLETLGALPLGWVAHVDVADGQVEHTFAARGIPFANGVAIAPDGEHVAVAATSIGLVYVYAVEPPAVASGTSAPTLAFSHAIPVPFLPDNIVYDDDGALIVTGHPQFGALVRVAANKTGATAPSWAISIAQPSAGNASTGVREEHGDARAPLSASKLVPEATSTYGIETLFQSDGSVFGSSSTTLRDSRTGTIYVAGLYERGILVCQPQVEHTDHEDEDA